MSKYLLALLLAAFTISSAGAKDRYHVAIMITNPVGAYTKIGGEAEIRIRQTSFLIGGTNYMGIYAGKQYRFEVNKYIKTTKKNETFWYVKVCGGDATYDGSKLSLLNDNTGVTIGPQTYIGGGAGLGRRINGKHWFAMFNMGAKYVVMPQDFPDESWERFRLFYATGPGAIFDLNMRVGYQF